ncbi:MAG: putative TPR repeat methyltransferase, partial [Planctomycetota bacterium]
MGISNDGDRLAALGRWSEAADRYDQAVAAGGFEVALFSNLGVARLNLGQLAAAEAALVLATESAEPTPASFFNLALLRAAQERRMDARAAYEVAVAMNPDYFEAWINLGNIAAALRDSAAALRAYERAQTLRPNDPVPEFLTAAFGGGAADRAPAEHVRRLFDKYAATFENHLQTSLEYDLPERMARLFRKHTAPDFRPRDLLDLGCGTGLVGIAMENLVDGMQGVDISSRMIEQARAKSIYTELVVEDILDFLKRPGQNYNLLVAADVLLYFGDLRPLLEAMGRRANPGAYAMFSTETSEGSGYRLTTHCRFEHARCYVLETAAAAGWECVGVETAPMRV